MICKNCIHYKICCNEGRDDEALTFCADFFEVVRCENCKYGIENGELFGRKVYLCSCMTNPNEFYGDFYCESGERKDNE